MHKYAQDMVERLLGLRERPASWTKDNIERFALYCLEKAPTCKCGCGEKTNPLVKGYSIGQSFYAFLNGNEEGVKFNDYYRSHASIKCPPIQEITEYQDQIITASILGDGCLIFPHKQAHYPRICWNMGNQLHAKHKFEAFKFLGSKYDERENPGFGDSWFCIKTSCHPILKRYYDECYKDKKLSPTPEILARLNEVGWAWLYGDDGHTDHRGKVCFLHTEGFSLEHTEMFVDAINNFIGMDSASVYSYIGGTKKRQMHSVRMKKDGSKEFMARIEKHLADGLEYKKFRS